MGKKTTQAKEEKKRKKAEEKAQMDAKWARVDAANAVENPLAPFAVFSKFERNGLNVTFETKKASALDEATLSWAFDLLRDNMESLYEQSEGGWSQREKKEELRSDKAWYLLARDQDGKPVAFCHFRFDLEYETEIVHCYDLQLIESVRKKGLGKFMMQIIELMANKYEMKRIMLAVFNHNTVGQEFFKKKLKYEVDGSSPDAGLYEAQNFDYEILSKLTKVGREAAEQSSKNLDQQLQSAKKKGYDSSLACATACGINPAYMASAG